MLRRRSHRNPDHFVVHALSLVLMAVLRQIPGFEYCIQINGLVVPKLYGTAHKTMCGYCSLLDRCRLQGIESSILG
jgi:hypothetical protein